MLWTRVNVAAGDTVAVRWTVATDSGLAEPSSAEGSVDAGPAADHTVHVAVSGLRPATTYWYGFEVGEDRSPVGRTRTLPAAGRPGRPAAARGRVLRPLRHRILQRLRPAGRADVDLVVHLGDYIYEAEAKHEKWTRFHRPRGRCLTLPDYRARHGQYKTDPDLQRAPRPASDRGRVGRPRAGRQRLVGRRRRPRTRRRRRLGPPPGGGGAGLPGVDAVGSGRPRRPVPDLADGAARAAGRPGAARHPPGRPGTARRRPATRCSGCGAGTGPCSARSSGSGWRRTLRPPATGRAWTLVASQVVVTAPIHLLAAGGRLGRRLGAVGGGLDRELRAVGRLPGGAGAAAGPAGRPPG